VGQSFPTAANSDHFASDFCGAINNGFDDGVQAGDITTSGEYANAMLCHVWLLAYLENNCE
jgi:hypothetical protein